MARALGPQTSLRLNASFASVQFDQQDVGAPRLLSGLTVRGSAGLRHEFGTRDSAGIQYSLSSTLGRGPAGFSGTDSRPFYLTHYGSLRWEHVLSQRSALLLEGGASYTPEAQTAGLPRRVSFYGGIGYSLRVRRSEFRIFARRHVTPAFGFGVSRNQTALGARVSIRMGRTWSFRVTGRHSISEAPEGFTVAYSTADDVFADLSKGLGRHFAISAEGRYRRRGASDIFPGIDSYQAGIFVSFGGSAGAGSGRIGHF
jgi:hypothetical protein